MGNTFIDHMRHNYNLMNDLAGHFAGSPIEPFISDMFLSKNSFTLYAKVDSKEDLQDFLHCAEKSGFTALTVPMTHIEKDDSYCQSYWNKEIKGAWLHLSISGDLYREIFEKKEEESNIPF